MEDIGPVEILPISSPLMGEDEGGGDKDQRSLTPHPALPHKGGGIKKEKFLLLLFALAGAAFFLLPSEASSLNLVSASMGAGGLGATMVAGGLLLLDLEVDLLPEDRNTARGLDADSYYFAHDRKDGHLDIVPDHDALI